MNDEFCKLLVDDDDRWHTDPDDPAVEWRYRVQADDMSAIDHINGADCWGRLAFAQNDRDTGYSRRPPDFGPHARIVERMHGGALWWNPTPEVWGTPKPWTTGIFDKDFADVKRLLDEGFCQARLSRRVKCPCCGEPGSQLDQYLGGIDPWPWGDGVEAEIKEKA
jgi:hypothetical protein